jgi:hypothetical protein
MEEFMSEVVNSNSPNFVVVKVDESTPWSEHETFYPVMPREEPHTYGTLQSAAELVASLIEDFHYTTESIKIYRLVPIADEEALPLIQQFLETLQQRESQ